MVKRIFCWANIKGGGSDGKESTCNAGDPGSIPGSERSPGKWNDNALQYSCPENSMNRGVWQATVHGVAKSQTTTERLTLSVANIRGGLPFDKENRFLLMVFEQGIQEVLGKARTAIN